MVYHTLWDTLLRPSVCIRESDGTRPWPFALDLTGHRVAGLGFLVAKVPRAGPTCFGGETIPEPVCTGVAVGIASNSAVRLAKKCACKRTRII